MRTGLKTAALECKAEADNRDVMPRDLPNEFIWTTAQRFNVKIDSLRKKLRRLENEPVLRSAKKYLSDDEEKLLVVLIRHISTYIDMTYSAISRLATTVRRHSSPEAPAVSESWGGFFAKSTKMLFEDVESERVTNAVNSQNRPNKF